jgi:uncharacterized membrane protein YoaK (UPF0700 family)
MYAGGLASVSGGSNIGVSPARGATESPNFLVDDCNGDQMTVCVRSSDVRSAGWHHGVTIAARVVTNLRVTIAPILSVPVFIVALTLTRMLAAWLERRSIGSLQVLLLVQFVLLAGFMAFGVAAGTHTDPNAPAAVWSGMLGVSAMAVQNAMVQISLRGAPSTAAMTTNITRFTMDVGDVFLGGDRDALASARHRASRTWPAIVGFAVGGAAGAALYAAMGISSMVLPAALALVAVVAVHLALRS